LAEVIVMPRQGNTVESCIILEWKVGEGDTVTEKTVICEAETDKATIEVEAGVSGTILKLLYQPGDDVPVMEPMAIAGSPGEDISTLVGSTQIAPTAPSNPEPSISSSAPVPQPVVSDSVPTSGSPAGTATQSPTQLHTAGTNQPVGISPRAKNLAQNRGLNPEGLAGTGPGGRIIERDIQAALVHQSALTPGARASLAHGQQLPGQGTGVGGRITQEDLLASVGSTSTQSHNETGISQVGFTAPGQFPGPASDTPIKGIRKIISDRMTQSLATTAQFTLNASAPASKLQELRNRFKHSNPELGYQGITINDLVLFGLAKTIQRFPYMNAHGLGDKVREFHHVHIGMAVDTPRGLMVPVIRYADLMTLKQLSTEAKRLTDGCRNGTVKPEELTGSTISVSNVGAMGIESFTPVLNTPEVAILGVCAMGYKPIKNGETIAFEPSIGFSLTINHQIVDGAPASRFLNELTKVIGEIDLVLAG
jgi:pyruvate dehydrogenase E2 component (dihydrolipoamide acetyltransferase)